jgi:hypothetical protein
MAPTCFIATQFCSNLATPQPIPQHWIFNCMHWWHSFNEMSVQFQVTLVKGSVWQCRWVGAPLRQQRTILFMMTTANQDLAITAGGFAPLSHHTMMTVRNMRTGTPGGISDSHKQDPGGTACEFHPKSALTKTPNSWKMLGVFIQSLWINTMTIL